MDTTKGSFVIGKDNVTRWSAAGSVAPTQASTTSGSNTFKCEVYTGALDRDDEVPRKPVAAMSYGGRVRIARLH